MMSVFYLIYNFLYECYVQHPYLFIYFISPFFPYCTVALGYAIYFGAQRVYEELPDILRFIRFRWKQAKNPPLYLDGRVNYPPVASVGLFSQLFFCFLFLLSNIFYGFKGMLLLLFFYAYLLSLAIVLCINLFLSRFVSSGVLDSLLPVLHYFGGEENTEYEDFLKSFDLDSGLDDDLPYIGFIDFFYFSFKFFFERILFTFFLLFFVSFWILVSIVFDFFLFLFTIFLLTPILLCFPQFSKLRIASIIFRRYPEFRSILKVVYKEYGYNLDDAGWLEDSKCEDFNKKMDSQPGSGVRRLRRVYVLLEYCTNTSFFSGLFPYLLNFKYVQKYGRQSSIFGNKGFRPPGMRNSYFHFNLWDRNRGEDAAPRSYSEVLYADEKKQTRIQSVLSFFYFLFTASSQVVRFYFGFFSSRAAFSFYFFFVFFFYYFVCLLLFVYDPFFIGHLGLNYFSLGHFVFLFGYDGFTLIFWYLTALICFLCLCNVSDSVLDTRTDQFSYIYLTFFLLVCAFYSLNILIFFVLFELLVIPFFYKMLRSSSRSRRFLAVFYLFFFTAFGSLLFLLGIAAYIESFGLTNFAYPLLDFIYYDSRANTFLGWCFVFSFLIKMPSFPFHTWLIEAHVEATTEGSVILAALILKLSGYGFYRFIYGQFYHFLIQNSPFFVTLAFIGVLYCSFSALRQFDLKRVLAYSSIVHMNLSFLSFFAFNDMAVLGGIITLVGHTFIAAQLFFIAGTIAARGRVKNKAYYRGLLSRSPELSYYAFIGFAGNMSLPGTSNFVGEFYTFLALAESGQYTLLWVTCVASFFCCVFSIYCFVSLVYGNDGSSEFIELTPTERFTHLILSLHTVLFGLSPSLLVDFVYANFAVYCEHIQNTLLSFVSFDGILLGSSVSIYFLQIDNWVFISLLLILLSFSSSSYFGLVGVFYRQFYFVFFVFILFFSPFFGFFSGGVSFLFLVLVLLWVFNHYADVHNKYVRYEDIYASIFVQFFAFSCLESGISNLVISTLLLELLGFCTLLLYVSFSEQSLYMIQYFYEYFVIMCVFGVFLLFGSSIFCYSTDVIFRDMSNLFLFRTNGSSIDSISICIDFEAEVFHFVVLELLGGLFLVCALVGKSYGFPFYFWISSFYEKASFPVLGFLNVSLFAVYYFSSFLFSFVSSYSLILFFFVFCGFFGLSFGAFFAIVTGGSVRRFLSGCTVSMSGFFFVACYAVLSTYEGNSVNIIISFMSIYIFSSLLVQGEFMSFRTKNGRSVVSFLELQQSKHSLGLYSKLLLVFFLFNYAGYVPGALFFYKLQLFQILFQGTGLTLFLVLFVFNVFLLLYSSIRVTSFFIGYKKYYRYDWPSIQDNVNLFFFESYRRWFGDLDFALIYKVRNLFFIFDLVHLNFIESFIYSVGMSFIISFICFFVVFVRF